MPHSMFSGSWSLRKLQATVLNDIWLEVSFFTLVATMVTLIQKNIKHVDISLPAGLISVLGTVLGLVISFRTSTAYERYSEGRKVWASIQLSGRNLAHMIWNHVPNERDANNKPAPSGATDEDAQRRVVQAQIEKKTMINLVHGFAVSVKHMLRNEPGIYYEDLYPLVAVLPRYSTAPGEPVKDIDVMPMWRVSELVTAEPGAPRPPLRTAPKSTTLAPKDKLSSLPPSRSSSQSETVFPSCDYDPESLLPRIESDRLLRPAQDPPRTRWFEHLPLFRLVHALAQMFKRTTSEAYARRKRSILGHRKYVRHVESNVPLEISLYLSSYLSWLLQKGLLTPALAGAITANIASLQDASLSLQRIRTTPLPFAYQAHLRMSLWLYLLYFPFALISKAQAFDWYTIPAVTFTSFLFLGFLEIGQEIEDPFGYDENDLDLDGFCMNIQRELAEITAHTAPAPDQYIFTAWNQPFAPADRRNAEEIVRDAEHDYHDRAAGLAHMRRTLLKSWRLVDNQTRLHYEVDAPITPA